MTIYKLLIPFLLTYLFTSCVFQEGSVGPAGRDGLDGEVEIYNGTFIIDSEVDFEVVDDFVSVASYSWDILDKTIVDEGVVLAYIQFEGNTSWLALPLSTPFENDVVILRYGFDVDNFDLIIEGEVEGNNETNEGIFDGDRIRVVAIPPSQMFKGKGIDYSNYEQVRLVYNLQQGL